MVGRPPLSSASLILLGWLVLGTVEARASSPPWVTPTPDELRMTSYRGAPGAPAIILSYEEMDDAESAEVFVHVRVKVLTSGGLEAGTLELPEKVVFNDSFNQEFFARTIHPDGSVAVFSGTPTNSLATDEYSGSRKVIAMPAVTVGSILEYGYHFASQNTLFTSLIGNYAPVWQVQQRYFVKQANFTLRPPQPSNGRDPWRTNYGPDDVRWVANLPVGASIVRGKKSFDLQVQEVPAMAREDFMPPASNAFYSVRFFYYGKKQDRYWGETGARVDDFWLSFDSPSRLLKAAVAELISASDNDDTKLRKLYAAVQKLDNTDFSREHSKHEEKVEGLKRGENADAVWSNRRGTADELTLLFVALARSAGFPAYPMALASRTHAIFDQAVLSWNQLDAMVAIVVVNGHEVFFDPGVPMCPFSHMAPEHSNVAGVSTEAKLVKIRMTPEEGYQHDLTDRVADLTLTPGGDVTGTVKVVWSGLAGLNLRRLRIKSDQVAVEHSAEQQLQQELPAGIEVHLESLTGLENGDAPLVGSFKVSGKLGIATGKRMLIPAQFFASNKKPLLSGTTRSLPLMFPRAYVLRDRFILRLPGALALEALPEKHSFSAGKDAAYQTQVQNGVTQQGGVSVLVSQRTWLLNRIDYKPEEYAKVQSFFSQVAVADGEQVILKAAPAVAGGSPQTR
jgi:hypothetical protein